MRNARSSRVEAPLDRRFEPSPHPVIAFGRALAGEEFAIADVGITGDELGAAGIGVKEA